MDATKKRNRDEPSQKDKGGPVMKLRKSSVGHIAVEFKSKKATDNLASK